MHGICPGTLWGKNFPCRCCRAFGHYTRAFLSPFRKYTGQTFLAYVNQIRMEHFHTDLLETDKNITFLLDKNGITNYKGFLRKFKEAYGESPKEVRRKQLGKKQE